MQDVLQSMIAHLSAKVDQQSYAERRAEQMTQSDDYEIETEIAIAMDEIASHEATLSQMLETVKFLSDQSFSTTQQAQTL